LFSAVPFVRKFRKRTTVRRLTWWSATSAAGHGPKSSQRAYLVRSTSRGTLRVNTTVTLARVVARLIPEYVEVYPDVSFELIMTDHMAEMVAQGFDLALWAGPLPDSSRIRRRIGLGKLVSADRPYKRSLGTRSRGVWPGGLFPDRWRHQVTAAPTSAGFRPEKPPRLGTNPVIARSCGKLAAGAIART
jgi:DNA-binding transcriptional LysR family regulator